MTEPQTVQKTNTPHAPAPRQDVVEIDLLELFRELLRHWFAICVAVVAGGVLAYSYSRFLIVPQYESTATMYILTKETTLTSLADLQIGTQLTSDYKVVVTTRTVLQNTIDSLGLTDTLSVNQFKGKITVENPTGTRMLLITVKDPDPVRAKDLANTLAGNSSDFIADIMEITPPKIIEEGIVAQQKSSPSNGRNAAIGALIGFVIAAGIVTVFFLMNDAVTTEDDVRKYLELSVLASLPNRKEGTSKKDKKAAEQKETKEKRSRLKQSRRK